MPVTGKANSTTYTLHKTGDIDMYQKGVARTDYTTKAWAQGDGGFEWTVPETGWYYLKSTFNGVDNTPNSLTHYQKFMLMKKNPGSSSADCIASDSTFQYDQTKNLALDKEPAAILHLEKGAKIFPRIWCSEAGKKFSTILWVVKFGGGAL